MKFDIVVLFYGLLEIADTFWATVPYLTADISGAASTVATWEVNTIWRTERFCGRWIHLRSASIAVKVAAADVHTFILSFYLFFMPIYSFGPIKRQVCVRALASHPRRVDAAGQDRRSSSPLHLLLRKKKNLWHPFVKLLRSVCVNIFLRVCGSGGGTAYVVRGGVTDESRQLVSAPLARQTSTAPPRWAGRPRLADVFQSPSIVREPAGLSGGLREWR